MSLLEQVLSLSGEELTAEMNETIELVSLSAEGHEKAIATSYLGVLIKVTARELSKPAKEPEVEYLE